MYETLDDIFNKHDFSFFIIHMRDYSFIIVFVLFIILIWFWWIKAVMIWYWNNETKKVFVREVTIEIVSSNDWTQRSKYLYSKDDVYSIEDRLFAWHTRSMNTYNTLKQNEWKICEVDLIWKRIWFFSNYQNVVRVWNCE